MHARCIICTPRRVRRRHIDTAADMQAFLRAVLLPGSSARTRKPKPKPSPLHGPPAPSPLQGPPAPSPLQAHQSHAGHDSSCSGEAGNEPGGEGEAPPQHGVGGAHIKCEAGGQGGDVADGEAGTQGCPAPSATAAGLDLRSWEQDAEGWWRRRLSATTCRPNNNQSRLGLHRERARRCWLPRGMRLVNPCRAPPADTLAPLPPRLPARAQSACLSR